MIDVIKYTKGDESRLLEKMINRSQLEKADIQQIVDGIVTDVRRRGDVALFEYTRKFDKFDVNRDNIKVSQAEIEEAYKKVPDRLLNIMKRSAERIKDFHQKQKINSWLEPSKNGEMLGQLIRPLERVGVYVPGGKAAYPSSVLMNIIPAQVAGVENIVMVTPPQEDGSVNPNTVAAAHIAGVSEIYKVGGAQAVAALAFGTESIAKVDKIVGPGNIFVALAKRSVYGYVNIDSVAGPSEILVIADESANPVYVAADLLSQAEHDEMASAILVTTSERLAEEVKKELRIQTDKLERKEIIEKSLKNYGAVIITENIEDAFYIANRIAPEHLEICVEDALNKLTMVQNAGAVFIGGFSPEPLGDYMAGPNHVLPTSGTARFFSPLSIDDYVKKSSIISFSESALKALGNDIIDFANAEGLTAHANSVRVRM